MLASDCATGGATTCSFAVRRNELQAPSNSALLTDAYLALRASFSAANRGR